MANWVPTCSLDTNSLKSVMKNIIVHIILSFIVGIAVYNRKTIKNTQKPQKTYI